jgi:hypothetical protein
VKVERVHDDQVEVSYQSSPVQEAEEEPAGAMPEEAQMPDEIAGMME